MSFLHLRRNICLGLLFMTGALLYGCSMDKPGTNAGPPSSGAPPVSAKSQYKIAGIGFQNDQFFKIIELGMKDAAAKNGVDLSLGNSAGASSHLLAAMSEARSGRRAREALDGDR